MKERHVMTSESNNCRNKDLKRDFKNSGMQFVLFTCYVAAQYVWLKIFLQISFSSRFSFDMTSILPLLNFYQASHSYIDISTLLQKARMTNKNICCSNLPYNDDNIDRIKYKNLLSNIQIFLINSNIS